MSRVFLTMCCFCAILFHYSPLARAEDSPLLLPKILNPSREQPPFQHVVTIPNYPGLEGMLGFSPKDRIKDIHLVRVLLLLDGELLVLPLHLLPSQKTYQIKFPAPAESMEYQFQIVYRDGKSLLSEAFTLDPRCNNEVLSGFSSERMRFASQQELLEKGQLHKQNEKLLNSVIHTLRTIVGDSGSAAVEISNVTEEKKE